MFGLYRTVQGDRLDKIARRTYGTERGGIVEKILAFNYHLADQPPVMPAGIEIELPEPPAPKRVRQTVKLWG